MYYVKIPLRNLCEAHELQVPKEHQETLWANRVKGLLEDLRAGVIPQWAVATSDMEAIQLESDTPLPTFKTTKEAMVYAQNHNILTVVEPDTKR